MQIAKMNTVLIVVSPKDAKLITNDFKSFTKLQLLVKRYDEGCLYNLIFKGMGFDKKAFIKLTRSMIDLDFSKELQKISCPTLVLCGEKDKANKSACEKLAELILSAEIRIIKNAGHEINIDAPKQLSLEINGFFKKK